MAVLVGVRKASCASVPAALTTLDVAAATITLSYP